MNWEKVLTAVRNAYREAPNPNNPISRKNYLIMLSAFGALVPSAKISDSYDTDFRRNLPGGGLSGFQVVSLTQCIADAETFAKNKPVYARTGECIAQNLLAILKLLTPAVAERVLAPLNDTFSDILDGNL